jgi:hypothetical protein
VKKCAVRNKIFCTGLTKAKAGQNSIILARRAQRTNQGRTPFICTPRVPIRLSFNQGLTKRCRQSWPTNSDLVYEPKRGGGGAEVSANEYSCTPELPGFRSLKLGLHYCSSVSLLDFSTKFLDYLYFFCKTSIDLNSQHLTNMLSLFPDVQVADLYVPLKSVTEAIQSFFFTPGQILWSLVLFNLCSCLFLNRS